MQTNVDNYNQADSLPNFRLFTWFFVVPGLLIIGLAGWGLFFAGQPASPCRTVTHKSPWQAPPTDGCSHVELRSPRLRLVVVVNLEVRTLRRGRGAGAFQ